MNFIGDVDPYSVGHTLVRFLTNVTIIIIVCAKTMRPIAVVGPQTPISDGAIRHQCARAQIPHIQAAWQPLNPDSEITKQDPEIENQENEDEEIEPTFKKISINFYPDSEELSIALARLLKYYRWESFTVLYDDDFGNSRANIITATVYCKVVL